MTQTVFETGLERACTLSVRATGAIAAAVWLWDRGTAGARVAASSGLQPGPAGATVLAAVRRACCSGEIVEITPIEAPRLEGTRQATTLCVAPLQLEGTPLGALCLYAEQPLGPTQLLEAKLAAARIAASVMADLYEQQLLARQDLIGVMSHELRTPLTAILGYADVLCRRAERQEDPMAQEFLTYIHQSAKRLQAIIEDGVTASRLESGHFYLALEDCDLVGLLREVVASFGPRLHEKRMGLLELGCEQPVAVRCDPRRMAQVLMNLLANAIKFAPDGSQVTLELVPAEDEIALVVRDQGPGIPAEHLEKIFEKHHQVDTPDRHKHNGMGLGLMVVRSIVQAHGGSVSATSEVGAGSAFMVTLPRQAHEAAFILTS